MRPDRFWGPRRVLPAALATLFVAGLLVMGVRLQHPDTPPNPDTPIHTRQWLEANAAGSVLTDDVFRSDLVRAGWETSRVSDPATCANACDPNWMVSTPALRSALGSDRPLGAALEGSTAVAVFGSSDDRVEIRRSGRLSPDKAAAELRARTTVGQMLTRVPRMEAGQQVRTLLDDGQVDPRVIAMLVTLTQRGPVRVVDLPAVPGEDAAGQPRRQLVLNATGDEVHGLRDFFAAQDGPYRPIAVDDAPAGLLVRYPPVAPPNLLDAFDGF